MTSQVSLSKYSLSPVSQEVCKRCRHLTRKEGQFYCKLLGAFLADPTLSQPCDLLEAKK
jgi:hypothetical protein